MDFIYGIAKAITRVTAQVRKELIQVRRRPGAFFSLVLGPFLIMAVFGLGYTGVHRALETAIIIPADLDLPTDPAYYADIVGPGVHVQSVTTDPEPAKAALE